MTIELHVWNLDTETSDIMGKKPPNNKLNCHNWICRTLWRNIEMSHKPESLVSLEICVEKSVVKLVMLELFISNVLLHSYGSYIFLGVWIFLCTNPDCLIAFQRRGLL